MAVRVTTLSGGGGGRIGGASDYSSVISRYANVLLAAIREQEQAEIDNMVLQYKTGTASWDEVKLFFEKKIAASDPSSAMRVNLQTTLYTLSELQRETEKNSRRRELEANRAESGITPLERYEIEVEMLKYETPGTANYNTQQKRVIDSYEGAEEQRILTIKERLMNELGGGGITLNEEFAINQALKSQANADSDIYNKLVQEEYSLRQQIANEAKSSGGKAMAQTLDQRLAEIKADEDYNEDLYQRGLITGYARDEARAQSYQEAVDLLYQASQSGSGISSAELENALIKTREAQELLTMRQQGLVVDVENRKGMLEPINIQNSRNPITNQQVSYKHANIIRNEQTGYWQIAEYNEDGSLIGNIGGKTNFFPTEDEAIRAYENATGNTASFITTIPFIDEQGNEKIKRVSVTQDPTTGAFYENDDPTIIYARIPSNPKEAQLYQIRFPEGKATKDWMYIPEMQKLVGQKVGEWGKQDFSGMLTIPDEVPTEYTEPKEKGFWDFLMRPQMQQQETIEDVFKAAKPKVEEAAKKVKDFGGDILGSIKARIDPLGQSRSTQQTEMEKKTPVSSFIGKGNYTPGILSGDFGFDPFAGFTSLVSKARSTFPGSSGDRSTQPSSGGSSLKQKASSFLGNIGQTVKGAFGSIFGKG